MNEQITRHEYIQELAILQQRVSAMGNASAEAIKKAMQALIEKNKPLAQQVMDEDDRIDDMIVEIENRCLLLIAKQQPIAHDLRIIATGFKISTDIERIGDHAFDIARTTLELPEGATDTQEHFRFIITLADCATKMLETAIHSYETADITLAEQVCRQDEEMDRQFAQAFQECSPLMSKGAAGVRLGTQLLFIAHFLERIGDHAVNIAEWVIYLETAERIRKAKK
jgi:phosphate transport system protein